MRYYADVCIIDRNVNLSNKHQRVQNLGIRFIYDFLKFGQVLEYRKKLHSSPSSPVVKSIFSAFSIMYSFTPPYLKERFRFLVEDHNLNLDL